MILWKKRWAFEAICLWNSRLQTARLLKCLKIPMSERLWRVNMLNGPKHCWNLHGSIFLRFLITLKKNQLEKIFLSSMWNLDTVCYYIDSWWQVLSLSISECLKQPIQMQLSRNQKIFSEFFFCICGIYKKFWILWKKRWASEVICFLNYRLQ